MREQCFWREGSAVAIAVLRCGYTETMSIYTKPPSQLETADLQDLLDNGAVENVRLEFKSEVPKREETLKKLSSFANTFGGYMIVGAKAESKDGRLQEFWESTSKTVTNKRLRNGASMEQTLL